MLFFLVSSTYKLFKRNSYNNKDIKSKDIILWIYWA